MQTVPVMGRLSLNFSLERFLSIDLLLICTYSNMSRKRTLKGTLAAQSHFTQDEKLCKFVFPFIAQKE